MSKCTCNPPTDGIYTCQKCWPYCAICNPHPNPIPIANGALIICESCTCPTISLLGNNLVASKTGLLKSQLDKVVGGFRNSNYGRSYNKYYSIASLIEVGEQLFKKDPKKLRKLEKFKVQIVKDIEEKKSIAKKKQQIIESVKILQKSAIPIDFTDFDIQDIIENRLGVDLNNGQLVNILLAELEKYSYAKQRKAELDALINEKIELKYHSYVKSNDYSDYLNENYKTNEHLQTIFNKLYYLYIEKLHKDSRELAISIHIKKQAGIDTLSRKLLYNSKCQEIFADTNMPILESCQKIDIIINPIIEKWNKILELKNELEESNITIYLA